jgi:hypothetical protein
MRVIYIFCFLVILLDSCIEPIELSLDSSQISLVVDGMITDQPGPYTVKVYKSTALEHSINKTVWAEGLKITIHDDQGYSEQLVEASPGNYQTNYIEGIVGHSYYIRIETPSLEIYESKPEILRPVGEIENVYYEFEQVVEPTSENFLKPVNGFNIYVDAEVVPDQQGYVRWRTRKVFEFLTYPETRKVQQWNSKGTSFTWVPAPLACSGYIYKSGGLVRLFPCECCTCWATSYEESPLLSDPQFTTTGSISHQKVAFVGASRRIFHNKFYIAIDQMSISESVYNFWAAVKKQKEEGSDLFQTPAPETIGNIVPKSENAPTVLGIFAASSIRTKTIFIDKSAIPYNVPPMDTLDYSCLDVYKNVTNIRPSFW